MQCAFFEDAGEPIESQSTKQGAELKRMCGGALVAGRNDDEHVPALGCICIEVVRVDRIRGGSRSAPTVVVNAGTGAVRRLEQVLQRHGSPPSPPLGSNSAIGSTTWLLGPHLRTYR